MTIPRLLVVSRSCYQPVNRAVFRELADRHGVAVHLAVPRRLFVGDKWRDTPVAEPGPYEISLLDIVGTHVRLQRFSGLDKLARAWKPTHVFVDNDPASLMTWQAARACGRAKLWVLTAENLAPRYARDCLDGIKALSPSRIAGPLVTWLLRTLLHRRIDHVFTLSTEGTRVMESLGFRGRATRIPLGFDPALFQVLPQERIHAMRQKLGLSKPTIAYFGRLTREKGVHLLVEALACIKDEPWQLLIDEFADYETPYAAQIKSMIHSLGIEDRVVQFDAKHEEMPDFMNAADIVVLPSVSIPKWKEQYGRVLPEAMACGKVVVGSDCGAIPELVGDHGRIFPEGDAAKLAAVLRSLLAMEPHVRLEEGRRAAAYAHANLSVTQQAQILSSMLAADSGSAASK